MFLFVITGDWLIMGDSFSEKEPGDVQILSREHGFPKPDGILYDMWEILSSSPIEVPIWDDDFRRSLEEWVFEIPSSFSEKVWYECIKAFGLGDIANFRADRWPEQFVVDRLPHVSNKKFLKEFNVLQVMPNWLGSYFAMQ